MKLGAFLTIILKNLKLLFRNKTSALIVLLGPILIIAIIGTAFNTSGLHNIEIGLFIADDNPKVESFVNSIKTSDFIITKIDSEDECIDEVRQAMIHLCMVFPEGFDPANLGQTNQIEFYVDYSRMNLVWMIWDTLKARIRREAAEIGVQFTEDLLDQLNATVSGLIANKENLVLISTNGQEMSVKIENLKKKFVDFDLNISLEEYDVSDVDLDVGEAEDFQSTLEGVDDKIKTAVEDAQAQQETSLIALEGFEANLTLQKEYIVNRSEELGDMASLIGCGTAAAHQACPIVLQEIGFLDANADAIDGYLVTIDAMQSDLSTPIAAPDTGLSGTSADIDEYIDKIGELDMMLGKFETGLADAKGKLNQLESVKNSTAGDLTELNDMLTENLGYINEISGQIDTVAAELSDLTIISPENVIKPIRTAMAPITKQKKFINYMLPSLLILVVMFISMLLSTTTVFSEKESKAFFRNFLVPVRGVWFVLGNYTSTMLIIMMQALFLLLVAWWMFEIDISAFASIMLIFLLTITVFVLLGMFIGYLFKTEETSTIASISFACLFLLFSSLVVPIESMSEAIGKVAMQNPFVLAETMLRKVILFEKGILDSPSELVMMLIYVGVLFCLVVVWHYLSKRD